MNWAGKRVLVTGAGGFIGSHLTERLVMLGADTRAFVRYNSAGSWGWLDSSNLSQEFHVVLGDVTDRDSVRQAIRGIDVVFHLAALVGIPYSYHAPLSYVRTNIEGTLNVLQMALDENVECVIQTSSSEVYGTAQYVPIDERHPLQGQSPYAATKIGADHLAESFHRSMDLPVALVRPFNTYGPRQSQRAVIPTIIAQCLAGDRLRLGHTTPTRDFNYVGDTVEGFIHVAASPAAIGQVINIGTGKEISVGDLATKVAALIGTAMTIETEAERERPEKSEVERLCAANSRAWELAGWQPKVSLEEGLQLTIDWIRMHRDAYRPLTYSQ